eukprot:CAMPEP_0181311446 /NCGR_PEP_ID=MMETSP1101-20121128/13140_1 /TAXON_ID=46948 /ORGANISM="Rhodomonas abbreviata, Strain Caron Lab Isolate" /LENGTH=444 /DNA_ID=CAMNT_0023418175 /DNA_START=299 /DNA_END=1629 /DNA_ORIENTATION=+
MEDQNQESPAVSDATKRCMPVQVPGCYARRPRRYNPDNPPPPRPPRVSSESKKIIAPRIDTTKKAAPITVPVCGVAMVGGGDTTLEDMANDLIDRAKLKKKANEQRPSWDSSWKFDMSEPQEEAASFLTDIAGVGVCGLQPLGGGGRTSEKLKESSGFSVVSCGGRIRDIVATAEPLPSGKGDEQRSILGRLLNMQGERQDPKGLIRRFEPSGGKLFVSDKDRAMSKAWLGGHKLLGGRAVRCIQQVHGEDYPHMRSFPYEVADNLLEPILGYTSPRFGISEDTATLRRAEIKKVLDFIHEGIMTGEAVLVHCRLGTNRSVTVATAYLMIYHGMTAEDAISLIEQRGPSDYVVRQPGFTEQLLRLEQDIARRSSEVQVSHWRDLHGEWSDSTFGEGGGGGGEGNERKGLTFLQKRLHSQRHVHNSVTSEPDAPSRGERQLGEAG